MDEILATLDVVIEDMNDKSVKVGLKGAGDEPTELLQALREGQMLLRRARASFRRADYLMQKGAGKLVGPEEGGGDR